MHLVVLLAHQYHMTVSTSNTSVLSQLSKQPKVHLKHHLEEPHVGDLVQSDLVLPQVDQEHLGRGEREQGRFTLKVLCCMGGDVWCMDRDMWCMGRDV